MAHEVKLGKLLEHSLAVRDAIHFPVVPVQCDCARLYPGQRVRISTVFPYVEAAVDAGPYLGIVDPFLPKPVEPGDKFWILMAPGSTQNLRHAWDHPDIPEDTDYSERYSDSGCQGCY